MRVQGPPGTGKTRSLLAYIELMVTSKPARPITPLLACTDTNAAVDNIVEGLVKRGIKVVRLGQPAKVGICLACVLDLTNLSEMVLSPMLLWTMVWRTWSTESV